MAEHRLEIASHFLYDGYVCECDCGWNSEEMATEDAALGEGHNHLADTTRPKGADSSSLTETGMGSGASAAPDGGTGA